MGIFSRLFRKGGSGKKRGDCCIKCGTQFASQDDTRQAETGTRLGTLSKFPGDVTGIIAGAAAICATPAHVCPQCGAKLCLGCSPMGGTPKCPQCGREMQ
jgi:hypothetical protein